MHTQKVPQQVIHFVFFNLKLRKTVEAGLWEVHLLAFPEAILFLPSILCRWLDVHVCFKRLQSVPKFDILSTPLYSRQLFSRHSLSIHPKNTLPPQEGDTAEGRTQWPRPRNNKAVSLASLSPPTAPTLPWGATEKSDKMFFVSAWP